MSYWDNVLQQRYSRRRALAATGASALGGALLAACGGGGSEKEKGDASGLMSQPADTTKQAARGGVMKTYWDADISDYNVHFTRNAGQSIPNNVYSRFMQMKAEYMKPNQYEPVGDMAESWEWSPDGLTLTMKLRQGANWHNLPPVNGRPVRIEDIAYTWKRYADVGSNRIDYLNALNPDAPVLSMNTTDSRTFVWKLAFPMPGLLSLMAANIKQSYILPTESESQYDIRNTPLGSGPYYVSKYDSSLGWTLQRHPGYYDKDSEHYYIETIERPIIAEYAQQMAQFRTGAVYDHVRLRAEDTLQTKREIPALKMYELDVSGTARMIFFGWKPAPPDKTPFRDERVRQAYSMSLDRDLFIDVINNVSGFRNEGIQVETRVSTSLNGEFDGWWLDPQSKDFGANGKYLEHDLAEARKLLTAAGFPNGLEVESAWPTTGYGNDLAKHVEIGEGMAQEAGFKFKTVNPDFNTEWATKYRDSRGVFEGIAYRNAGVAGEDPVELLWKEYSSVEGNLIFTGFDPDGRGNYAGDKTLEDMIRKGRAEVDIEKRKAMVYEAQRYLAKKLYTMRLGGQASRFTLAWPVIMNVRVWRGGQFTLGSPVVDYVHSWINPNEAPVKKA